MAAPHVVPVPGHEPTPIEAAGLAQWLATDMHAATVADLRRRLSAEVARAQGAAKRSTPHASNPAAFGQGTAARYAQTPLLAELRVPPPVDSGAAPKVDRAALITLHSQNCQTCKGGAGSVDCYGVVMAHVATGFDVTHAWIDGPPPTERLWPAPGSSDDPWTSARGTGAGSVPSKADEVLDGLVNKLRGSGVIFERDADATGFVSSVFGVAVYDVQLPPGQMEAIEAAASPAQAMLMAATAAGGLAARFMHRIRAAAVHWGFGRAAGGAGARPPNADRGFLDAWTDALGDILTVRKWRLVMACQDLNDYIHPWRYAMYPLWDLLEGARPGDWYAKADVADGFYKLPLAAASWDFFSFRWRGTAYSFRRTVMGCRVSPAIFSWLSAEANRILRARGICASICFRDDFLLRGRTKAECAAALELLKVICSTMGLTLSPSKTSVEPVQDIVGLGLRVTKDGMVMIPPERLVRTIFYATVVVDCERDGIPVPRQLLASLGGLVGWLSQVNPMLVPFTHRAADLAYVGRTQTLARVQPDVATGLAFLVGRAREGRLSGVALLPELAVRRQTMVWSTSDATTGEGGADPALSITVTGRSYLRVALPGLRETDIVLIEMLAALVLIVRYGPALRGLCVVHGMDNTPSVYWVNSLRAARAEGLVMLRVLAAACEHYDVTLAARWLPRWWNHANDRVCAASTPQLLAEARALWATDGLTAVTHGGSLEEILTDLVRAANLPNLPEDFSVTEQVALLTRA